MDGSREAQLGCTAFAYYTLHSWALVAGANREEAGFCWLATCWQLECGPAVIHVQALCRVRGQEDMSMSPQATALLRQGLESVSLYYINTPQASYSLWTYTIHPHQCLITWNVDQESYGKCVFSIGNDKNPACIHRTRGGYTQVPPVGVRGFCKASVDLCWVTQYAGWQGCSICIEIDTHCMTRASEMGWSNIGVFWG